MARTRLKMKGRSESGTFVMLPHAILRCENYRRLSAYGVKLLIDLFAQYNGSNNGDFCAAWSVMNHIGWRSKSTLSKALKELRHYGFIVVSRQGGRKKATLYGITWRGIDACGGKLDIKACVSASGTWREPVPPFDGGRKRHDRIAKCSRREFSLPLGHGHIGSSSVPVPLSSAVH